MLEASCEADTEYQALYQPNPPVQAVPSVCWSSCDVLVLCFQNYLRVRGPRSERHVIIKEHKRLTVLLVVLLAT